MNSRSDDARSSAADDGGSGLIMSLTFAAAILTSTGAVCLIGLVGGWWTLGLAFAAHVAVTAILILEIAHVLNAPPPHPLRPCRRRPDPRAAPGDRAPRPGRRDPGAAAVAGTAECALRRSSARPGARRGSAPRAGRVCTT
jgi:hypothetical protein